MTQREKVFNKSMNPKKKKLVIITSVVTVGVVILFVVSLLSSFHVLPGTQQSRLIESAIPDDEIKSILDDYGTNNLIAVPSVGPGWSFEQLNIDDAVLAEKLNVYSVICPNGTRDIIEMNNAFLYGTTSTGTTFAFYYLGNWWLKATAIPEIDVDTTLSWIIMNAQ